METARFPAGRRIKFALFEQVSIPFGNVKDIAKKERRRWCRQVKIIGAGIVVNILVIKSNNIK